MEHAHTADDEFEVTADDPTVWDGTCEICDMEVPVKTVANTNMCKTCVRLYCPPAS